MAIAARPTGRRPGRDYPPLLAAALAMLLLLAIFPSALNLPQSSPAETLEYAPVPPEDQQAVDPPSGNFSSLGLGSSSSVGTDAGPSDDLGPGGAVGGRSIKVASTKRCVGNPPRQTEDPMSPPCVGSFSGDNFGATHQGVSADEVRVLIYLDAGCAKDEVGSRGVVRRECNQYTDLAEPSEDPQTESYPIAALRLYQRYFNERFQTYGRFVHFYAFTGAFPSTPESARADAAANYAKLKPFAVLVFDRIDGEGQAYSEVMASKGVLNFGGSFERLAATYRKFPGLLWSYAPSLDESAAKFVDYVCTKVVGKPVAVGDPTRIGSERRLALVRPPQALGSSGHPFSDLVKAGIEGCGGTFLADHTQNVGGAIFSNNGQTGSGSNNQTIVADLVTKNVTTVIWLQNFETGLTKQAGQTGYLPEWVLAANGDTADIVMGKYQDQNVFQHAWIVTNEVLEGPRRNEPCVAALKEADPGFAFQDTSLPCGMYRDIRQLFTGIQVAGPRLTVDRLDRGFHAIPPQPSTHPGQPSCFYRANDFTCVKDSIPMWWDPSATSPYSSAAGCWRVPQGGRRHLAGDWPPTNIDTERNRSTDPCNAYTSGRFLDPSPGPESAPPQ